MEFSFVAGKVHAFICQFRGCVGNLIVHFFKLVFCGRLPAGDVVRIPGFIGQSVDGSVFPVDFHFSGIDVSCRAVNGDFVSGFDDACCSVNGYLFGRIGSQCDFVAESDSIFRAAGCIGTRRNGYIGILGFDGRMFSSLSGNGIQLVYIDRVCAVDAISNIGDGVSPIVKSVLGQGYRISGRAVIDCNASIVHNCIAGCHAFEAFQGFGKTDFQVVIAIGYDAEVVFCGQFVGVCNPSDDVDLFVQFLLNNVSCVTAIFHAIVQCGHIMFRAVFFFNNEAGNVGAVHTRFAVAAFDGKSVRAIDTVQSDGTVFTINSDGRSVFTLDTNRAVFTGRSILADSDFVIQFQVISSLSVIVCLGDEQVAVGAVFLSVHFDNGMLSCQIFYII